MIASKRRGTRFSSSSSQSHRLSTPFQTLTEQHRNLVREIVNIASKNQSKFTREQLHPFMRRSLMSTVDLRKMLSEIENQNFIVLQQKGRAPVYHCKLNLEQLEQLDDELAN